MKKAITVHYHSVLPLYVAGESARENLSIFKDPASSPDEVSNAVDEILTLAKQTLAECSCNPFRPVAVREDIMSKLDEDKMHQLQHCMEKAGNIENTEAQRKEAMDEFDRVKQLVLRYGDILVMTKSYIESLPIAL